MRNLSGIYLVVDPKRNWEDLLQKLEGALRGGLNIVQIWNHWAATVTTEKKQEFLTWIKALCADFDVPVLMHDDWQLAVRADLDGVHFDEIPPNFAEAQKTLEDKIIGITVGNDLDRIRWAEQAQLDYISFCALFPTSSVDSCEIVDQKNILKAREITDVPIFLSGGIQADNLGHLGQLDFDGIAVISGVLDAANPTIAVQNYLLELQKIKKN